jgi:hypothetical protein
MPFDPSYPPANAEIESAPLRAQFTGLKDLIDAIPSITGVVVDGVTSLPSTDAPTVNLSLLGTELHFGFGIPKGEMGPQGPAFANTVVDAVTTLNPTEPAAVGVSFDGSFVRFTFAIPRGNDGSQGASGSDGAPGEVSAADLATAIATTSSNSNSIGTIGQVADQSYNPAQIQDLINKVDALILALRR